MSKQEQIKATEARIPLELLSISALNPRQSVPEKDVVELADSIWTVGLIQSIAGMHDGTGGVEIVAGGRRLRALQYLAQKHDDLATKRPELANPMVMLAPDASTAETWANAENVARRDLHPAEEIRAYSVMEAKGASVSAIARAFTVTDKHVYRRLALAHLPAPVLDALAANEITLSMAACFTICGDEQLALTVLEQVRGEAWSDHQMKRMLAPDSVKASDRRVIFVGEDAYKEAGGRISGDLFTEETLFDDPVILGEVFKAKLEQAAKDKAEAEGWKWVATSDDPWLQTYSMGLEKYGSVYRVEGELSEDQAARYDELSELEFDDALDEAGQAELAALQAVVDGDYTDEQKAHAGVYVYVNNKGQLQASGGLVKPEDKAAAIEAGVLQRSAHSSASDEPKSPISAKLADDLSRVAQGARQHALLRDPDLILDLLAYQLSHDLNWRKPLGLSLDVVPTIPSTEGAGYELDERLTSNPPRDMWDAKDLGASFRAFRKKGSDHIRGELARFLAGQYRGGDETLSAFIAKETKPAIREVWTPTAENFFKRVGGPYLNDLWCDLLDLAGDDAKAKSFIKMKKAEKAAALETLFACAEARKAHGVTDAQAARIAAWVPEGME